MTSPDTITRAEQACSQLVRWACLPLSGLRIL